MPHSPPSAEPRSFDVVITDDAMPGLTGTGSQCSWVASGPALTRVLNRTSMR
jgi:hypothetical protein